MILRSLLFVFSSFSLVSGVFAQGAVPFHCGHDELHRLNVDPQNDQLMMARIANAEAELGSFTQNFQQSAERGGGSLYIIPVVFHIIHNNGPENIGNDQIFDVMRVLNEDFNKQNSDWDNVVLTFLDRVGDIGIEFRLATIDPSGNCTNGITRTVSALTNDGGSDMKALIQWPRNKYVNVWVSASANGSAGYTFRPGSAQFYPEEDGIVLQHTYTGSIGTSTLGRSRTLTHEMGHFFNLKHTWGNGNDPELPSNCDQDDDVSDTPNSVGWTTCTLSGASCGSLDNVENFMDYSYCSKMFTAGQGTRMIAALNSSIAQRSSLWQSSNLNSTGTNGNEALCAARFTNSLPVVCAGGTVTFNDESFHNVTSRIWSFPGGTPATSTEMSPTVTYDTPGLHDVTLTASDGTNDVTTTASELVRVFEVPGQADPLVEGFESATTFSSLGWSTGELSSTNFTITGTASYSGSKSAKVTNTANSAGGVYHLYAPTVDMSNATAITLSFRFAYAQRSTANNDRLRVYVSNDCGATWSLRTQLQGLSTLPTTGVVSGNFVPNGPSQWSQTVLTNINSTYHVSDFRLRFEFQSEGGNNLYIDDVNINGVAVGLEEVTSGNGAGLIVMPNPAKDNAQVVLNVRAAGRVQVDLLDVLGRTVKGLHNAPLPQGVRRMDLQVSELPAGLYFIRMEQEGQSQTVRFVVE
ncbi:MAG: T9SS type A sorting domain-containing protein [Flavobacteriales bacterium]|nr:T9SS type A sorting domain-containing protein [Flavobacteriales bacterium]